MSDRVWREIDNYIEDRLVREDEALSAAVRDSAAAGLPAIAVSAAQGKMLHLIALSIGARRILEVGTLGGYSAIWMARAGSSGLSKRTRWNASQVEPCPRISA